MSTMTASLVTLGDGVEQQDPGAFENFPVSAEQFCRQTE